MRDGNLEIDAATDEAVAMMERDGRTVAQRMAFPSVDEYPMLANGPALRRRAVTRALLVVGYTCSREPERYFERLRMLFDAWRRWEGGER